MGPLYRNETAGSGVRPDMRVMADLEVMSLWRRPPGHLDRKVCVAIAVACVVTLAVTAVGPRWFWSAYGDDATGKFWIHNGLAMLTGAMLLVAIAIRGTTAPLRLALALPLAHVAAIIGAWTTWSRLSERLADARHAGQIVSALPMAPVLVATLALFAVIGRLASRRDPLQGMLTMALASLLAIGLWLPIASAWYCHGIPWSAWDQIEAAHPYRIAGFVLVPPLSAAVAFTLVPPRLRWFTTLVVPFAFAFAVVARLDASLVALSMYGNFIHILLALTIAAIVTIGLLGLSLLARARRAAHLLRDGHTGRIECDGTAMAISIAGWLRGPELVSQPFTITTAKDTLIVPAGVAILAPVPPLTTQLRDGELLELARSGDQVVAGGFVEPDAEHPFRGIAAPQPGPAGIVIARAGQTELGDRDVALSLWRPCVAYLVIAVAVALPGLVSAFVVK